MHTLVKKGIEETVKLNFSKHLEDYKYLLKNTEQLFACQLEALTSLRKILRKIVPKRSHPDMNWYDACDQIARSFQDHAEKIDDFICEYAAILPHNIIDSLEHATVIASSNAIELEWGDCNYPEDVPKSANEDAGKMYKFIEKAIEEMQLVIDSKIVK